MLNPWVILAALVALSSLTGGAYIKGRGDGAAGVVAKQAHDDQLRMETLQLAQQGAAEAIAAIEVKNVTIRQKLETRIVDNPVYRDCVTDDGMLKLTNEAITGQPAPDSVVPGADPDDGKDVR